MCIPQRSNGFWRTILTSPRAPCWASTTNVSGSESARSSSYESMAHGLAKGDRVAIWAPNIWEWPIAALAVHRAGAIVVPINTRFKGREAGYVLQKSKAKMLFAVTDFLDTDYVALLRDAKLELPDLRETVVFRGPSPTGTVSFDAFLSAAPSVSAAALRTGSYSVTSDDLSPIMFT